MRKLKLQVQMTIDGFVASPDGRADWMAPPDKAGGQTIIELADTCDTILMGRKMTPDFVAHWENVVDNHPESPAINLAQRMVNMRKIVFSRTLTDIKGRNLEVENGDLATVVMKLKEEAGKDIMVYGGANFASELIGLNLVDEYYIIVNPVAIGSGLAIFKDLKKLKLESSISFSNGKVMNKYLPI